MIRRTCLASTRKKCVLLDLKINKTENWTTLCRFVGNKFFINLKVIRGFTCPVKKYVVKVRN